MEATLKGTACHLCKKVLETPVSAIGGSSRRDATSTYAPVVYYPECKHWLHLSCVRTLFASPVSSICGACITSTRGAGVYQSTIQRLQGLSHSMRLTGQTDGGAVIGQSTAIDLGDNPAVALRSMDALERDSASLKKERKALVTTALQDQKQFEHDYDIMRTVLDTNEQVSNAFREQPMAFNKSQQKAVRAFFTDKGTDLWTFVERGGAVRSLVQMGATWDELCSWGLSTVRMCQPMGVHGCTIQWCGMRDIAALCRPPIYMTFVMFFSDICHHNFDTLRGTRLTVSMLLEMKFTFERNLPLLLGNPKPMLRAFDHIAADECISRLEFTPLVMTKLKQLPDTTLHQMLHAKFSEWQAYTP